MDLKDFCHSNYAVTHNIDNTPNEGMAQRCELFIQYAVEPLQDLFDPHSINHHSGYRCNTLNDAVGGKTFSQHKRANAWDFDVMGFSLEKAYQVILNSSLKFDQLLLEGHEGHQWIHFSYDTDKAESGQRMQAMEIPNP